MLLHIKICETARVNISQRRLPTLQNLPATGLRQVSQETYADAFFRVFGSRARHFVNFLQAIQLLLTVSVLILGNGQSISQISLGPLQDSTRSICFIMCLAIFMAAGMIMDQIRTLRRFGRVANLSILLNVVILFIRYDYILSNSNIC